MRHELLLHEGLDDLVEQAAAFVGDAARGDGTGAVLAGPEVLDRVRDTLGESAARVTLVDTAVLGRNPVRVVGVLQQLLAPGMPLRVVGVPRRTTVLGGRRGGEQLLDELCLSLPPVRAWDMWLRCPYDVEAAADSALQVLRDAHPAEDERDAAAARAGALFAAPLPAPPAQARRLDIDAAMLGAARVELHAWAADQGLTGDRRADLVSAVNEAMTNTLSHAEGRGTVLFWRSGDRIVVEVRDDGVVVDPLAGRLVPPHGMEGGRGLWLINHLCDLVSVRSDSTGTVVRMTFELGESPGAHSTDADL